MKKLVSLFLPVLVLFCSVAFPVSAASDDAIIVSQETIYNEDGSYYVITIKEEPLQTRSGSSVRGSKDIDYYDSYGLGWTLTVTGTFIFPGTSTGSAYCTDAMASRKVYNDWTCSSYYANYSGNKATAYGTFKAGIVTKNGTVSLSCSSTGSLY